MPIEPPAAHIYHTGQGIGSHCTSGTIRIIRQASDWQNLPETPIIVVQSTTPAMLPHLTGIQGIIAEQPGLTSHAAMVSRELGITAICGVAGATALFRNGQQVTIDGATGRIDSGGDAR